MPSYIAWITYSGGGGSDGYDYLIRAPNITVARRRAKAYAAKEARKPGWWTRVTVKVEREDSGLFK